MTTRTMTVPARFKAGIEPFDPARDAADLAAFQRATFGEDGRQLDPARSRWLFEDNPHRIGDSTGVWICRRKGEIVGQQAEIAFRLAVEGREIEAAWAIDLMVKPEWRIRGVGPGLMATHSEQRTCVAGLTQNEDAVNIYRRAGWAEVGTVPVYMRPLDPVELARRAPFAARLRPVAPVLKAGLRALDAVQSGLARVARLRLEPIDRFDERVDEAWAAASPDYPVLATRDFTSVRWAFDQRPEAPELHRFYLVRGSKVLGYVVLRRGDHWEGFSMTVIDFLAPARWVAPLLTLAAHWARRQGAFVLMCRAMCTPADRALRVAGFLPRGLSAALPLRMFVHCTVPDEQVRAAVGRPDGWFLTAADADLS
ncbi:MAG TPA: GNAT family N-acetyltransferase [Acidimicrobiales bacterium]